MKKEITAVEIPAEVFEVWAIQMTGHPVGLKTWDYCNEIVKRYPWKPSEGSICFNEQGKVKIEYRIWVGMKSRCQSPTNPRYYMYGAKGVSVCEKWKGKDGFKNFISDMGDRPSANHSIDRYPNKNGDYEPRNCRWATDKEQANNRNSNIICEIDGVTKNLAQWGELNGIPQTTIRNRINRGWAMDRAVTTPSDTRFQNTKKQK